MLDCFQSWAGLSDCFSCRLPTSARGWQGWCAHIMRAHCFYAHAQAVGIHTLTLCSAMAVHKSARASYKRLQQARQGDEADGLPQKPAASVAAPLKLNPAGSNSSSSAATEERRAGVLEASLTQQPHPGMPLHKCGATDKASPSGCSPANTLKPLVETSAQPKVRSRSGCALAECA